MIRIFGLVCTVLLLAATIGHAQPPSTDTELLEGLRKSLDNIKADLDLLQPLKIATQLQSIEARLNKIEAQMPPQSPAGNSQSSFYPSEPENVRPSDILSRFRDFDDRLRRLEDRVGTNRDAVRIPPRSLDTGSIRLRNTSGLPATVFVNGASYSLSPYESRTLSYQPAGVFNYEVEVEGYGVVRPRTTRTLAARDLFQITIYPPG